MSIVTKSTKDLVPKTITHMIISDTKNYIYEELLIHVYANEDQVRCHSLVKYTKISLVICIGQPHGRIAPGGEEARGKNGNVPSMQDGSRNNRGLLDEDIHKK